MAVLTLAIGIGATTAMFSVIYATWLAPLQYRDATRSSRSGRSKLFSMLEALRQLFETKVAEPAREPGAERERALRLAAAALLFEIARADATVRDEELTVMRASLQSAFGVSREETEELVRLAEQQSRSAASLYEFTALVDAGLDAAQKKRVVELLWLVAFADGAKDAHEEHLVRRIAGLLHVPHPDFIDAKRRARDGGGA